MARQPMTETIARAAATDAGNRNMRQHDRNVWNEDDYDVATAEYARLWPLDQLTR